jgi:hypothetical protein
MKFFKSKINIVATITFAIGVLTSLQTLEMSSETKSYLLVAIGILTALLRTFFSTSRK